MPVIRTFISHARVDAARVQDVLRRVAPYGVRPWIDQQDLRGQAGRALSEVIPAAIADPWCRSLSLFITAASVASNWVQDEVGEALARIPDGWRVIPIVLDDPRTLTLPPVFQAALRARGANFDTIYLDPSRPGFASEYQDAVLTAGGATVAENVVLHLGHRDPVWEVNLPAAWQEFPAVDLRLHFPQALADCSPTNAEWEEVRDGFTSLRRCLRRVQKLRVAGRAPLGVAVIAGRTWDVGTGVELEAWNGSASAGQAWASGLSQSGWRWTPNSGKHLSGRTEGNLFNGAKRMTVAFLRREDQELATRKWSTANWPSSPMLWVRVPEAITTPDQARAVLGEALGVFAWLRTTCTDVEDVDLVLGMPLALDALFAHHLRQTGVTIHYHDQVLTPGPSAYRLAISWR